MLDNVFIIWLIFNKMANEFKTWTQEKKSAYERRGGWSLPLRFGSAYGGILNLGSKDYVFVESLGAPVMFEINNVRYKEIMTNLHNWTLSSFLGSHGPSQELGRYAAKSGWAITLT